MLWFHRSRKFFDLLEECESNWDGCWSFISILDVASYIWWCLWSLFARGSQEVFLRVCEILRHCEDNACVSSLTSGYLIWRSILWSLYLWLTADVWLLQEANYFSAMTVYDWTLAEKSSISCEYVRYSGVVRTMPTYLLWPLGIWSRSLFCNLYICGLQLTFGYCSKRTTLALWLFMTGYWLRSRAEHSTLLDGLELGEDISKWNCFGDGTRGSHVVLYCKRIL